MKTKLMATIAIAVVVSMVFAVAGATTYSWFEDSEETNITVTTGKLNLETNGFYIKKSNEVIYSNGGSIPGEFSIEYDDGRNAQTGWISDSKVLSIAGNPGEADIEIGYTVIFSGDIDYRYYIDVDYPENLNMAISIKDEVDNEVACGSWITPVSEPSGPFEFKCFVTLYIESLSAGLDGAPIKITNMITQYNNPLWTGNVPNSLEDTTLKIVPGGGTQTGVITVNSAEDFVYLNTLAKEWVSLYSNGEGTDVSNYRENEGGKGTDYYYYWSWDIKLATDLDMGNVPIDSINIDYWDSFNGNGHTISNVVIKDGQSGLFKNSVNSIDNLTVRNISVNAPDVEKVGAIANQASLKNVHVENATITGGKYTGGLVGKGSSFINCSVKNISALLGVVSLDG